MLEGAALAAILAISLALRLYDLEGPRSAFPDLFDEGIRAEQLLLMEAGFRPFRDIYAAQGLLLLDLLYPFYVLFGGTLGAIRLGVGLLSVLGLVGIWWSGRQVSGAFGGIAAAFLLAASPAYLEGSRLALAEVPSMVPAFWALGCCLRWWRGGSERWLYGAAALATIAVLIKPMVIAVAVPLGLFVLFRPGLRPRQLAICLGVALGIVAVAVLAMGPSEVYQQIVQYRVGARQAGSWDARRAYKEVVLEPLRQQPGLFAASAVGGLLLVAESWRRGLALLAWPLATFAMLVTYSPLHPKHLVYLYPPLALLAGSGLGQAAWLAWKEGPIGRPTRLVTVGLAVLLAAATLGTAVGAGDETPEDAEDADLHVFDHDAVRSVQLLSGPRDFILTDHPYVAALARRMVPPNLVDPSRGRTRAGVLTGKDVIDAGQQYDTTLVLVWADRLRRLSEVPAWLERNYTLSHVFGSRSVKNARGAKDRSIYLRRDADLDAARVRLESSLAVHEPVRFGDGLLLLGASVSDESVAVHEQFTLTLGWQALEPMSTDYHVIIHLVDARGDLFDEQEHDLEGSARGTSTWRPGRWLFRTFALRSESSSSAGEYWIQVGVVDPKTGIPLRPELPPDARFFQVQEHGLVTVAAVQIR